MTTAMRVPLVRYSEVWHVGSLNPADKGRDGNSHEGAGLSVSRDPEVWAEIAKLVGPTHGLRRADAAFLNYHRFTRRDVACEWAVSQGLLFYGHFFEVSWYDSEWDDRLHTLFMSREQAAAEFDAVRESDDSAELRPMEGWCGTRRLSGRMGFEVDPIFAEELAISCWVEDATALDGIWWQDQFAPERLSAPRGVIVLSRLPFWTITQRY
jgi:hypothetical protein